jgi:uncharacterized protein YodC (DUF2158 family)
MNLNLYKEVSSVARWFDPKTGVKELIFSEKTLTPDKESIQRLTSNLLDNGSG